MLIVRRKINEEIHIGEGIRIVVVKTGKTKVSIGVEAPKEVLLRIPIPVKEEAPASGGPSMKEGIAKTEAFVPETEEREAAAVPLRTPRL